MLHFNLPVVFILVAAVVASGVDKRHQDTHPSRAGTPGPRLLPLPPVSVPIVPGVVPPAGQKVLQPSGPRGGDPKGPKLRSHLKVDTSGSNPGSSKAGGATGGPAEGPQSSRSFTSSMYASDSAHSKGTTEEKRVKPKLRIEISQVKLTPNRQAAGGSNKGKQPATGEKPHESNAGRSISTEPRPGKLQKIVRGALAFGVSKPRKEGEPGELKGDIDPTPRAPQGSKAPLPVPARPVAQPKTPKLPAPRSPYDRHAGPYPLRGPLVVQNPDPLSAVSAVSPVVSANSGSKGSSKPAAAEDMKKKAHRKARVYEPAPGSLPGTPEAHSPTPEVHIPNQDGADPIPNPPQPQAPPPRRGDLTVDGVFGKASTLDTGKKPKAPWKP